MEELAALIAASNDVPAYVRDALRAWHALAVQADPDDRGHDFCQMARTAWKNVELACLRWERDGRARRAGAARAAMMADEASTTNG